MERFLTRRVENYMNMDGVLQLRNRCLKYQKP